LGLPKAKFFDGTITYMPYKIFLLIGAVVVAAVVFFFNFTPQDTPLPTAASLQPKLASLAIPFVKNEGQAPSDISYYADTFAGKVAVVEDGLAYSFLGKDSTSFLKESFLNSRPLNPKGTSLAPTKVSYFIGQDTSTWQSGLDSFNSVSLGELWQGIDVELRAHGNNVEKLFTVEPGADPDQIQVELTGSKGMKVTDSGTLRVTTSGGDIELTKPVAYQEEGGTKTYVEASYAVTGKDSYAFALGAYDTSKAVVIDPLLASTFAGGSGSDLGLAITIATSTGDVYITGSANSGFPTTSGAYDETHNTGTDVFVSKLNSTLTTLSASTFIGGSGADVGNGIALDSSGNVYITGSANSGFPTTSGAYDETHNTGTDVFVSKLNSTLTTLSASTFIGGSGADVGRGIVLDSSGNVYITGSTADSTTDFPATSGAYDETFNGLSPDVFVSKLNSGLTSLSASTYLGGSDGDQSANGIALDSSGNVYITGFTSSTNFPTTPGAYDTSNSGSYDAFVSKLNSGLTSLSASTYLGGCDDAANAIAVDSSGNVFVVGRACNGFPTTSGAYDRTNSDGENDAFVSKLNSTLTTLSASTFIGGDGSDNGLGIVIDSSGNVYVTGSAGSGFPTISGAYDTSHNGSNDVFVSKLNSTLTTLSSSTFIGGSGSDSGQGIVFDASGNVYIVGSTADAATDFPVTSGAYDETNNGSNDVFVAKFDTLAAGSSNTAPTATIGTPSQVSTSSVSFTATISDPDLDVTSLLVEHSRDNSTWASSTLGAVTATNGTVATSTGSITSIDTNTSTTTLTITWNTATDLASVADTSVYLRIRPNDGTADGSTATSAAFTVDTTTPATPTAIAVYDDSSSQLTVFFTSTNSTFITENVTTGALVNSSSSPAAFTGLSSCTRYSFRVKSGNLVGDYSAFSDEIQRNTLGCGGGGGGGGSSAAAAVVAPAASIPPPVEPPVPTPVTPSAPATPAAAPTITELQAQLAVLMAQLRDAQGSAPIDVPAAAVATLTARPVAVGTSAAPVKTLQQLLNFWGYTVSASGAGSPGSETTFFGPATRAALIKFQLAEGILWSAKDPGAGIFGPKTRAKVREKVQ
jgi:hypothetical protein